MIIKRGRKWCLLSRKTRRNLGCYPTREGAVRREGQVQWFKRRSAGLAGFAGDYQEIVAEKASTAIRAYREEAYDALERANQIERAWRDWDYDTLVDLNVVGFDTARKAEHESGVGG